MSKNSEIIDLNHVETRLLFPSFDHTTTPPKIFILKKSLDYKEYAIKNFSTIPKSAMSKNSEEKSKEKFSGKLRDKIFSQLK